MTPPAPRRPPLKPVPLVQLMLTTASGPADEATVYFQAGATAGYDAGYDAARLPTATSQPALAWADAQGLAISGRPALTAADVTLPLSVALPAAGPATLRATRLLNLPAGTYAYLLDAQTGTATDPGPATQLRLHAGRPRRPGALCPSSSPAPRCWRRAPAALASPVVLYPNPAHGTLWLERPAGAPLATAQLLDVTGRVVWRQTLGGGTQAVPVQGLPAGLYVVRLFTATQPPVATQVVIGQ